MRRRYTDVDKATVLHVLELNQGNAKKTSRETGIPLQTIRDWRIKWERNGIPEELLRPIEVIASQHIEKAEAVRDKALLLLEEKLDDASARELGTIYGILTDKINVSKGLATSRTEHIQSPLPPREELKEVFAAFIQGAWTAAQQRSENIIDAEYVEQAQEALPPAKEV